MYRRATLRARTDIRACVLLACYTSHINIRKNIAAMTAGRGKISTKVSALAGLTSVVATERIAA